MGPPGPAGTTDFNALVNKPAKFFGIFSYTATLDEITELNALEFDETELLYGVRVGFLILKKESTGGLSVDEYAFCVVTQNYGVAAPQNIFDLTNNKLYSRTKNSFNDSWSTFTVTTFLSTTGTAASATRDANGNIITQTYATKTEVNSVSESIPSQVRSLGTTHWSVTQNGNNLVFEFK